MGLACPSVLFPHVLLPSSSHTHTFQGWGEPETPRTPGQGLPTFSKVGSTSRFLGLCRCVGTSGMGSTSLSERGALPTWGSLPTSLLRGNNRKTGFLLRGAFIPSPRVPSHTVILPSCPRIPAAGKELPRKHRLGQVLAFLNFRDGYRKEGNKEFSPAAPFPTLTPSLQGPLPAS